MRRSIQLTGGLLVHAAFAVILSLVLTVPTPDQRVIPKAESLVWTAQPGIRNGGGRGGDGRPASAATLRRVVPQALPTFTLPRMEAVLGAVELPGAVVALAAADALGAGVNDLGSGGRGETTGGPGSGTGEGPGVGSGDRPFVDGSPGVTSPVVIFEKKPEFTPDAMRARIEGAVLLEAIVLADGTVGGVSVVRAMDRSFGLDHKAIEAVRSWRFRPGTYHGRPVAVKVLIELRFTLR